MNGIEVILEKIELLGLLTLIGFIAFKTKWLGNEVKTGLHKVIFRLTLPMMIFSVISGFEFSGQLIGNGLMVFLLAYPFLGLQYLMGVGTARIFRLPASKKTVHALHTMFGNVVFLGYPLIAALFPDSPAFFYAAVYHLAQMTIIWTFGVYSIDPKKEGGIFKNLGKLINPNTIAFVFGFVFMMLKIPVPGVVDQTLSGIGSSSLYLSMIYIGMLMADFRPAWKDFGWDVLFLNLNKLLIAPVLVLMVIIFINQFTGVEISFYAAGALVMQSAMPCMAILVILARNYGADENAAMVNVFSTTLAGLLTLPFVFWLLNWWWFL
jgi:predicted permease